MRGLKDLPVVAVYEKGLLELARKLAEKKPDLSYLRKLPGVEGSKTTRFVEPFTEKLINRCTFYIPKTVFSNCQRQLFFTEDSDEETSNVELQSNGNDDSSTHYLMPSPFKQIEESVLKPGQSVQRNLTETFANSTQIVLGNEG